MKKLILLFLSVTLLLSACSGGGASMSASGAQAWLDQPVNGTVLPLGVFPLKAHARHASGSGITRIEFLVNGVPVGAVDTDAAAPLVYGEVNWNPSAPGGYKLMARAYAADGSSDSAAVQVCVSDSVTQPEISDTGYCLPEGNGVDWFFGHIYTDVNRDGSPEGPLDNVIVRVTGCVPDASVVTAADGRFEFHDLPNGRCLVAAFKDGWERVGTVPAGFGDPVNVIIDADLPLPIEPASFAILMAPVGGTVTALPTVALGTQVITPTFTPISPTFTLIPPTFTPIPPTFTPVPPTNTPVPVDTQGPEVKSLFQTPNPTYYGGCSGSFTMQAAGTDPSGVASVQFGYRYETGSIVGPGYLVDGSFIGNATYSVTIDNNAGGQAYSTLGGANGIIRWFVQFSDSLGNVTFVTDQIAEIQFCPG